MNEPNFLRKSGRILFRDVAGPVSAAIVDKNVLEVCVRLAKNAFDTFSKVFLGVVERSDDADE